MPLAPSSHVTTAPTRGQGISQVTTGGGGSETQAAAHWATIPLQASIARKITTLHPGSSFVAGSSLEAGETGSPARDVESPQTESSAASPSSLAAQHEGFACCLTAQHPPAAGAGAATATRRWRAVITAGSRPRAFAQASRSASVWQQHLVKHCSAVAQPQGLSMQGNGRDRSLPASRFAAGESWADGETIPKGNGNPEATSV